MERGASASLFLNNIIKKRNNMKIMTFNARVWTRDTKPSSEKYWKTRMEKMKDLINEEKPDILCFQEMMFPATCFIPKGYKRVGLSVSHSIFVRKSSKIKAKHHRFRIFFEYTDIISKEFGDFRLFNVHTRWEEKVAKKTFSNIIEKMGKKKCILCGDFNSSIEGVRKNGLTAGFSVREELGLEKKDTFQNYTREYQHAEIDHFIIQDVQVPSCFKIINSYEMSDHKPIIIEF